MPVYSLLFMITIFLASGFSFYIYYKGKKPGAVLKFYKESITRENMPNVYNSLLRRYLGLGIAALVLGIVYLLLYIYY